MFSYMAYRSNLTELDEIQRYFSQKLTSSFPNNGYGSTLKRNLEQQDGDCQEFGTRMVDPDGHHLLEKSSHLISQVSTLINGKKLPCLDYFTKSHGH